MSELFENCIDEPKMPKGPIQSFLEKWMVVIVCYTLSVVFLSVDVKFANMHYPEIPELTHFTGRLEDFSVIDSSKNHEITMKLMTGDAFRFSKVDFIQQVKTALARGKQIDLWVDGAKKPEIWQIAVNDKIIVSREALVGMLKERNSNPYRTSIYLFLAGSFFAIMLSSKNKLISEKLYYVVLVIIALVALAVRLYLLLFVKQ